MSRAKPYSDCPDVCRAAAQDRTPRRPARRRAVRRGTGLSLVLLASGALACAPEDGFMGQRWLAARQMEYLRFVTEEPLSASATSVPRVIAHLEREARDSSYSVPAGVIPDDAWDDPLGDMFRLEDTADFDALRFINLLYGYRGHPAASEALWQRVEEALLSFKYWYTDPTPERFENGEPVADHMWYWTENHILIFRTCEFLAGQLFPDRVFEATGETGQWHRERAREAILEWIDERARFGFAEWNSNVYYNLDMRPLLALVEWSEDPLVSKRATMVLDLLLLENALHLHRGTFGPTHGRSMIKDKGAADTEDSFPQSKLLFDDTSVGYPGRGSTSGAMFARARRYRLPRVIRQIARHDAPMINRERMNLPLDEVPPEDPATAPLPEAPFGLDYRDEANLPLWWAMNAQTAWQLLPLTLEVADRENLWERQFSDFALLRSIVDRPIFEETAVAAQQLAASLWPAINQSLLKRVNTYTYRTDEYMISTAQDYRKGVRGAQTHIWQATLDERALVFTQHPTYKPDERFEGPPPADWSWQKEDEPGPGYWTGEGSHPRAAQHENVAIAIYAPQYASLGALGLGYRDETHAYFPHAHFDEVVQEGHWTFGRRGDAYVALYSWRETLWRDGQPEVFRNAGEPFDLVAPGGANNVWIAECGSAAEWPGGFAEFRDAIAGSAVEVVPTDTAFEVTYHSPSQGAVELGWEGPLLVRGAEQPLDGYPRMDNPFARVDLYDLRYEIARDGYGLTLDFATDERTATAPRPEPPDGLGGLLALLLAWLGRV